MPRGNLENFGKKKAHGFGTPEREAAMKKAAEKNKKAAKGKVPAKEPAKRAKPKGHGMQSGTSGYGLMHGAHGSYPSGGIFHK